MVRPPAISASVVSLSAAPSSPRSPPAAAPQSSRTIAGTMTRTRSLRLIRTLPSPGSFCLPLTSAPLPVSSTALQMPPPTFQPRRTRPTSRCLRITLRKPISRFKGRSGKNTYQKAINRSIKEYLETGRVTNIELRKLLVHALAVQGLAYELDFGFESQVSTTCVALSRCLPYNGMVWRGQSLSKNSRSHFDMMANSHKTGEAFTEPGFLSTSAKSLHENTRYSAKEVWIAIHSVTGAFIQPYTTCKVHESECEVLFCHGTKFQTISYEHGFVEGHDDRKHLFILKEAEPSPYLPKSLFES